MRSHPFRRPSPALVISVVALIAALAGTSYAALILPKNSVGTKQLKNNAVTSSKIKNGAVTASKINTTGLTVTSANSANTANIANNANQLGGQPPSAYAPTPVASLVVSATGVQSHSSAATIAVQHIATGEYCVGIPFAITGGAANVTGDADVGSRVAYVEIPAGAGTFCASHSGAQSAFVDTVNSAGVETNEAWTGVFR